MNNTEEIPAGDSSIATQYVVADMIKSSYAHYIIFGCAVFALCWAGWCTFIVSYFPSWLQLMITSWLTRQNPIPTH